MTTLNTRIAPKNARMATIDRLISAGGMNPAMTAAMRLTRARLDADQPAVPESDTARIAALEGRVAGLEARVEQLEAAAAPPAAPPDEPAPAAAAAIDTKAVYARMGAQGRARAEAAAQRRRPGAARPG